MGDESDALSDQSDGGASDPRSVHYVPVRPARPIKHALKVGIAAQTIAEVLAGKYPNHSPAQIADLMRRRIGDVRAVTRKAVHIPPAQSDLAVDILNRAMGRKGQFVGLLWVRPMAVRKGIESVVTKEVRTVARVGIEYDNQAAVIEGRASGDLPPENAGLPWGKWLHYPYLIEHKGNLYFRLYPVNGTKAKTVYRLNGQIARREEIEGLCLAKEFYEKESACFTLNLSHLRRMR